MNESPPPLPQWLLLRDPGIRKPALIVKFCVDSIPLENISPIVAERRPTKQKPAIFSIEAPQACFVFGWLDGGQGCPPVVVQARQVIRMNGSSPTVAQ